MWTFFPPFINNSAPLSVKWFQINGICAETVPTLKKKWLIVWFLSSGSSLGPKRNNDAPSVQIFLFQASLSGFHYCLMLDKNPEHPQANTC